MSLPPSHVPKLLHVSRDPRLLRVRRPTCIDAELLSARPQRLCRKLACMHACMQVLAREFPLPVCPARAIGFERFSLSFPSFTRFALCVLCTGEAWV